MTKVFCPLRKNWLVLTPEEWVRQHVIQYFISKLKYPESVMKSEFPVDINNLNQRIDLLIFNKHKPFILVECKKPKVEINQSVLNQAMRYAQEIESPYVYLTNGIQHVFAQLNFEKKKIEFIEHLPEYNVTV